MWGFALSRKAGVMGLVQEGGCPDLNLGGLQFKVDGAGGARGQIDGCWDVLGLDPDVPIVQVRPELGAAVKRPFGFAEDVP